MVAFIIVFSKSFDGIPAGAVPYSEFHPIHIVVVKFVPFVFEIDPYLGFVGKILNIARQPVVILIIGFFAKFIPAAGIHAADKLIIALPVATVVPAGIPAGEFLCASVCVVESIEKIFIGRPIIGLMALPYRLGKFQLPHPVGMIAVDPGYEIRSDNIRAVP